MKSLCAMILLFLCTALVITLDAAPVLPSGYESEAVGEQQFDEMAKMFLNIFSKILTISRDGSIQADNELGKNLASNFPSAVSKNPDPNNDPQETLYNGFNPILSSIGKRLSEGGEIQSDDKLMQTIMNLFGTLLSGATKKTDNGVQSRNESEKELGQTLLNFISNFFSAFSDPNNGLQSFIKGFINTPLLPVIDNLLSAEGKNGEVQSASNESDLTGSDVVGQTFVDILNTIFSAGRGITNPKNEAEKDFGDTFLSFMGKLFGNGEDEIQPTNVMQTLMSSLFSAFTKKVENGEIQSSDKIVPAAFLNLFSNILSDASQVIEPSDEVAQSGLSTVLSTVGRKINGDQGSQIQSDIDIDLPKAILNLFGTVGSALQKKVNPKDELAQILLTLFNTLIPEAKNSIGGAQEIRVDTLPTYTAKHFDQSMLESMNEEAAMVETDMDLTDEAKIQLYAAILGSLA